MTSARRMYSCAKFAGLLIAMGIAAVPAFAGNSYSGLPWGFGSCCLGEPCGTIPCDDQCAGRAFDEFGENTSDAEGELKDAYVDLMEETIDTTKAVGELSSDVVSQYNTSENDLLSGLDASTKTRQAEFTKSQMLMKRLAEQEMNVERGLFVSKTAAEGVIHNTEAFIPKTEVGGLEEAAKNNESISKIFWTTGTVFTEIHKKITEFQKEYAKNIESGAGAAARNSIVALAKDARISFREEGGISKETFAKDTYPSFIAFDAINRKNIVATDELDRKIQIAKNDTRTFHLTSLVASDVQSPVVIPSIYSKAELVSPNGTSLNQYLDQDALSQKDWFQAVRLMSENDLKREMLIQDAHAAAIELSINRMQQSAGLAYVHDK